MRKTKAKERAKQQSEMMWRTANFSFFVSTRTPFLPILFQDSSATLCKLNESIEIIAQRRKKREHIFSSDVFFFRRVDVVVAKSP